MTGHEPPLFTHIPDNHSHLWRSDEGGEFIWSEVRAGTATGRGASESDDGHRHNDYLFPDVQHDHGSAPHHHHLAILDPYGPGGTLFYLTPAWHIHEGGGYSPRQRWHGPGHWNLDIAD